MWASSTTLKKDNQTAFCLFNDEMVPESLEDMMNWAYVRQLYASDPSRKYKLVHATGTQGENTVKEVAIHFQGFVLNSELRPLGNWRE